MYIQLALDEEYISIMQSLPLFQNISKQDLTNLLKCLTYSTQTYKKGETISISDTPVKTIGIVLHGCIHMVKEDIWGDKTILALIQKGQIFGETFACGSNFISTVSFLSAQASTVLYLPFHRVMHQCSNSCLFHHMLIENMVKMIADKNVALMKKVEIISQKTLRKRILTFLHIESQHQQTSQITLSMGRIEMAEYLSTDRSALTRELNHMQKEGLIKFNKNTFTLL